MYLKGAIILKKTNNLIKNEKVTLTKEEVQMADKPCENMPNIIQLGNCKLKPAMRQHYTLNGMATIQNTDNIKCWCGCGVKGAPLTAGENVKWCRHSRRPSAVYYKLSILFP